MRWLVLTRVKRTVDVMVQHIWFVVFLSFFASMYFFTISSKARRETRISVVVGCRESTGAATNHR